MTNWAFNRQQKVTTSSGAARRKQFQTGPNPTRNAEISVSLCPFSFSQLHHQISTGIWSYDLNTLYKL